MELPLPIITALQNGSRRMRLQKLMRAGAQILTAGLLGTLLLTLLGRLYPLAMPNTLLAAGLGITLIVLLGTLITIWLWKDSPHAIARRLDTRLKLDERLSASIELATRKSWGIPPFVIHAQLIDTLNHLSRVDPLRAFPLRPPWRWLTAGLVLAVALGMSVTIPNPQVDILQQRAQTEQTIARQQARLEQIQADLLADELLLETAQGQELEQTLEQLVETLQQNILSLEEAMAAVSEAEQTLATLEEAAARQEQTLNELAQSFSQFDSTAELAEALQQRNLAQANEMLRSAGNQLASRPDAAQNLTDALRQAAETAEAAGDTQLADQLDQAAEALEQALAEGGDPQAAQEALQQAGQALQQAGEQLAGQETVQQALANIQEARRQLAEAQGQVPQVAQSQQQGTGLGENVGGAGREEPGPGAEGLFTLEDAPDQMSTGNGPNEGRVEAYESLYAPDHLGGQGGPVVNPDPQGAEGGIPIGAAPVDPNQDSGAALVPYNQIYGQYADAAGQALDDSYIPLGMKGYIRQYFGALEPK